MNRALRALGRALRADGHAVCPAELIDAGRAAALTDPADREQLRLALRMTLAKTAEAATAFDSHFQRIFDAGVGGSGKANKKKNSMKGDRPGRAQQSGRLGQSSKGPQRQESLRRQLHSRMEAKGRRGPKLLLESEEAEEPGTRTAPSTWNLASHCTPDQEALLTDELEKLVTRLRAIPSRRRRQGKRGPIDVQAALRRNLASFGVPLHLPRRDRRRQPPRLLLLVDVSYSAIRASGLFILAAAWLMDRFRDARTLFFVNEPVDVTNGLTRWLAGRLDAVEAPNRPGLGPGARRRGATAGGAIRARAGQPSFRTLIESLPGLELGAPSDYGRVLEQTVRLWQPLLDRRSVVLLFGDGRTNRFPACPWFLEEISDAVGRLIWLVPEPAERWGSGDSALDAYAPTCDLVAETNTLQGLLAGLRSLMMTSLKS